MEKEPRTQDLGIWKLAVLALLREAPMHPYQMRLLLKSRHKDEILALRHGSLYHAIGRLERAGRIAVEATGRDGRRPERTTYRITQAGEDALDSALKKLVAVPRREPSDFMAAMSFLIFLPPQEAATLLREREAALEAEIAAREAGMAQASACGVVRIHLIESEYLLAMLKAELEWVRVLNSDLKAGRLTWDLQELLRWAGSERQSAAEKG